MKTQSQKVCDGVCVCVSKNCKDVGNGKVCQSVCPSHAAMMCGLSMGLSIGNTEVHWAPLKKILLDFSASWWHKLGIGCAKNRDPNKFWPSELVSLEHHAIARKGFRVSTKAQIHIQLPPLGGLEPGG